MKGSSCEQVRQHFRDGWYVGVHRFPGVRRSVVEWLHRVLAAHGVVAVNNLRDWQKKASERREALAQKAYTDEASRAFKMYHDGKRLANCNSAKHWAEFAFDSRDAEIDLLIQIIEKQSEALALLSATSPLARTTQAEVQQIIERLVKDE